MASRLELHEIFCALLGTRNVYYDPPESVKMQYDAIRYNLVDKDIKHADNKAYLVNNQYDGVIITRDPDTTLPDVFLKTFEMCSFGRSYTKDNLHHYPFTIYY